MRRDRRFCSLFAFDFRGILALFLALVLMCEVFYNSNLSVNAEKSSKNLYAESNDKCSSNADTTVDNDMDSDNAVSDNATTECKSDSDQSLSANAVSADSVNLSNESIPRIESLDSSDFYTLSYWSNHIFSQSESSEIVVESGSVYLNGNSCIIDGDDETTCLYYDYNSNGEVDEEDSLVSDEIRGKTLYGVYNASFDDNIVITMKGGYLCNIYGGYNATGRHDITLNMFGGEVSNIYGLCGGMCHDLSIMIANDSKILS